MYCGRLAPSPTGYLHAGHAATFLEASRRAEGGTLILRIEDLDRDRCRPEYATAILEDLRRLGIEWQEGPFYQRDRLAIYESARRKLYERGAIYPCSCSRRDVLAAVNAPHVAEAIYPGTCRPTVAGGERLDPAQPGVNWRFRVPAGRSVRFADNRLGEQSALAGVDFGDFIVWRRDGIPAYELAVVVDDAAMSITEVVRGEDLLISTARQLLLYETLELQAPTFYHCPLVRDEHGERLAKRAGSLSLREMRAAGMSAEAAMANQFRLNSRVVSERPVKKL